MSSNKMVLEKIDNNNNQQIDTQELSKAIANWFFDKTENINEIKKQLNSYTAILAQSLRETLEEQYKEISKKNMKNQNEQKIIALYNTLLSPYGAYLPLIKNNFAIEENSNTIPLPNLLNTEHNHNIEFNNIINRAKNKYWSEYWQLTINMKKQYSQKNPQELNDYIKYESIIRAMEKYYKELSKNNDNLLKKYGFYNTGTIKDDLWRDQKVEMFGWRESFACSELFKFLKTIEYKEYEKDQNIVSTYNKNLEKILKDNSYALDSNVFQKHTTAYENFKKEAEQIVKETKYEESIKYLSENSEPENPNDIESYMNHVENTLQYSEKYEILTKKYWPKMLAWYERTMGKIAELQSKNPGFLSAMDRMSSYNQKLNQKKKDLKIDDNIIDNYIKYTQEANISIYTLQERCQLLTKKLSEEVSQDTDNNFIFSAIKESIKKQQKNQIQIDNKRSKIKSVIPRWYYALSTIAWAWNWLVDATVSVWTGIWVLITSWYRDQHETIANVDRATKRNNFFKIGYSSAQLEPPVKDGSWNLSFDNGAVQLWSWVANMLVLLSWAWIVWKWVVTGGTKIWLKMTESMWRKAWLFTWASMQGLPNTFQEYIGAGINKSDAWKYALWTTLLTSSLEMIAPNDMFFKNPSIKWVLMQLWKEKGTQVIAKVFIKNISKEIIEEIWQESLQLIVGRIINKNINDIQSTNLETGLTWADFWTTAILTALTTGLVSSKWSLNMAKNTMNHTRTIQWIVEDKQRYVDYTSKLQGIIDGKVDMEIDVEQAEIILDKIKDVNILMQKEKDNIIQKEIKWEKNDIYIEWKKSRFWFDSEQTKENSSFMDQYKTNSTPDNIEEIRGRIKDLNHIYEEKIGKQLPEFTNTQIQTIINTHLKPWELGKLTQEQLKAKTKELSTTIPDIYVRRFLLEWGFCGKEQKLPDILFQEVVGIKREDTPHLLQWLENIAETKGIKLEDLIEDIAWGINEEVSNGERKLAGILNYIINYAKNYPTELENMYSKIWDYIETKEDVLFLKNMTLEEHKLFEWILNTNQKGWFSITISNISDIKWCTKELLTNISILLQTLKDFGMGSWYNLADLNEINSIKNIDKLINIHIKSDIIESIERIHQGDIPWTIRTILKFYNKENWELTQEGILYFNATKEFIDMTKSIYRLQNQETFDQFYDKNTWTLTQEGLQYIDTVKKYAEIVKDNSRLQDQKKFEKYYDTNTWTLTQEGLQYIDNMKKFKHIVRSTPRIPNDQQTFEQYYDTNTWTLEPYILAVEKYLTIVQFAPRIQYDQQTFEQYYDTNTWTLEPYILAVEKFAGITKSINRIHSNQAMFEKYYDTNTWTLTQDLMKYLNAAKEFDNITKSVPWLQREWIFKQFYDTNTWTLTQEFEKYLNAAKKFDNITKSVPRLQNQEMFEKFYNKEQKKISQIGEELLKKVIWISNHPIIWIKNISSYLLRYVIYPMLENNTISSDDITILDSEIKTVEDVFQKNHLPMFYKKILVHNILHRENYKSESAIVKNTQHYQQRIIFKDLLKSTIDSNNLDIKVYIDKLLILKRLTKKIEDNQGLSDLEQQQFDVLIENLIMMGKKRTWNIVTLNGSSPQEKINHIKEQFLGENIFSKEELFKVIERKVLWWETIESIKERMEKNINKSSERKLWFIQGNQFILPSDKRLYIKWFMFQFFESSRDSWRNAPEFIWSDSVESTEKAKSSDMTPYDVDFLWLWAGSNFDAISSSSSGGYDDGLLLGIIENDNFIETEPDQKKLPYTDKYEMITRKNSIGQWRDHAWIRHSLWSSTIDFIMAKDHFIENYNKIKQLKYYIAKQGFYTPIIDKGWKVLFALEEYNDIRKGFFATPYDVNDSFTLDTQRQSHPLHQDIQQFTNIWWKEKQRSSELKGFIIEKTSDILWTVADHKWNLNSTIINEMWSTARWSDLWWEADFDYLIRLPIMQSNNIENIANSIMQRFSYDKTKSKWPLAMWKDWITFYQIRLFDVDTPDGKVDLDIAVSINEWYLETDPDLLIEKKYEYIREKFGEAWLQNTLANIKWAKKILKEEKCYKKWIYGEWWLGWLWVENRILYHNGDATKAFESFVSNAYKWENLVPFSEFKKTYSIVWVGINARTWNSYENFIVENMTEEGYIKMAQLAKRIVWGGQEYRGKI